MSEAVNTNDPAQQSVQHCRTLMKSFRQFQSDGRYTDIQIQGQDQKYRFQCHRLILASASSFIASLLKEHAAAPGSVSEDEAFVTVLIPELQSENLIQLADIIYNDSAVTRPPSSEMKEWLKILGIPVCQVTEEELLKSCVSQSFPCPFKDCLSTFKKASDIESHIVSNHMSCSRNSQEDEHHDDQVFHSLDEVVASDILDEAHVGQDDVVAGLAEEDNDDKTTVVPLPLSSFPCNICDNSFATQTYLQHHLTLHSNECKECGKNFKSAKLLKQHILTHGAVNVFFCTFKGCGKTFKTKRYLVQHSRIHDEKRSRRPCEICHRVLAGRREYVAHLRIHSGEKPYTCKDCHKSFRNRSTFNTHTKLHKTNSRTHVCRICKHAFIQSGDLRKHFRSRHTNEKPFSCDDCGKTFARSDYLLKHLRSHNNSKQQRAQQEQQQQQPQAVDDLDDQEEDHVNALLSEAMLNDGVALEGLETAEPMELVLHGPVAEANPDSQGF